MRAKIFYFTLQDEQTKEEKLDWFERTKFEEIPFDHITPDQKANWVGLVDGDYEEFLLLIDKDKSAKEPHKAIFEVFSRGVETGRDEWVYDFSSDNLESKIKFFINAYNPILRTKFEQVLRLKPSSCREQDLFSQVRGRANFDKIARSLNYKL